MSGIPGRRSLSKVVFLVILARENWTVAESGSPAPLFLDQTEAPSAEKKFFWRHPHPLSQGLDPALLDEIKPHRFCH